jgi:hypothetical protein
MVTRRAVLKGTAAVSIGAIAAAHGAAPAEAAVSAGFGQLTGGAVAGFWKLNDAFQVSMKFDKIHADIFFKEELSGGVAVFFKFFQKQWTTVETQQLSSAFFKNLQTSDLYFSKVDSAGAEFFVKDALNQTSVRGTFELNSDGLFYNFEEQVNRDGEIG